MKITRVSGVAVIEPSGIPIVDLIAKLTKGEAVDSVKTSLGITDENEWRKVADAIFEEWSQGDTSPDHELLVEIDAAICQYALALPVYGTVAEALEVQKLPKETPPNIAEASEIALAAAMEPRVRALQLVGRFMKIDLFKEFAYFIESATLAYYRSNVAASFLTIVPVIEGMIQRWYGFPGTRPDKASFKTIKEFIGNSLYRQPVPMMPKFHKSHIQAANEILVNHLYKHTGTGPTYDNFNRHLALHMLDDANFYSPDNVRRAFLLIDLLSEIYIFETHTKDSRWHVAEEEVAPHMAAYLAAIRDKKTGSEQILAVHAKHQDVKKLLF